MVAGRLVVANSQACQFTDPAARIDQNVDGAWSRTPVAAESGGASSNGRHASGDSPTVFWVLTREAELTSLKW